MNFSPGISAVKQYLISGVQEQGLKITDTAVENLTRYILLLHKWNQAYNLTAVQDPLLMVDCHILDSLTVLPFLQKGPILDVGTGAGLPGLPLAIVCPQREFILLDSKRKKINFINHVIALLQLTNVRAIHTRVEDYKPQEAIPIIVSRAFAANMLFANSCDHLADTNTCFIAMKGKKSKALAENLPNEYKFINFETVNAPRTAGSDGERTLIFFKKINKT